MLYKQRKKCYNQSNSIRKEEKAMTKVIRYTSDYLCMISDYGSPERHQHPTAHLVIADEGVLRCKVGTAYSECAGIVIRSGAEHEIQADGRMIVFLLADPSGITELMNKRFLASSEHAVLPEDIVSKGKKICRRNDSDMDIQILKLLGIYSEKHITADERVLTAIAEIESASSITPDMMEHLCKTTFLSQSRLSHLFKAETGNTLAGYLAFMKMRKAFEYAESGMNLTDAAMHAGFDSSSHLAATCKRMFGISLSAFLRSQKE